MGDILALPDFGRQSQQFGKQATAAAGIHQQIGLLPLPFRHQGQRFSGKTRHLFTTLGLADFQLHIAWDETRTGF